MTVPLFPAGEWMDTIRSGGMPVRFESLRSLIRKPSSHWFLSDLGMEGGFRTGIDRQGRVS